MAINRNIGIVALSPFDDSVIKQPYIEEPHDQFALPVIVTDPIEIISLQEDPLLTPTIKIDPIYTSDPGGTKDPGEVILVKGYVYSGRVIDSGTGAAIPYASVLLMIGKDQVQGTSTDANGNFAMNRQTPAETIVISSTGYKAWQWPATVYQKTFELEPDLKDLDPVDLEPGTSKKNDWLWLLLIGAAAYAINKN